MVQKYQNEIPPIFYYGISTKSNEKDLKIPNLQALTLGRIIKMTLYLPFIDSVLCIIRRIRKKTWKLRRKHPAPRSGSQAGNHLSL